MRGKFRLVKLGIGTVAVVGLFAALVWPKKPSHIHKAVLSPGSVTHRNYIPTAMDPTAEDARAAGKGFLEDIGFRDVDESKFVMVSRRSSKEEGKRPIWSVGYAWSPVRQGVSISYDMEMRQVVQYFNHDRNWYPGKKFRRAEQQQIPKERGPEFVSALAKKLGMPKAQDLEFAFRPEEGHHGGDPVICAGFVRLSAHKSLATISVSLVDGGVSYYNIDAQKAAGKTTR
ncbi:MAG: hypothetical protein IT203_05520 [Fimbriimonadaceae bacterium]|nr:hypothetical protein [Fimbriimonadaceae bacterium]